VASERTPVNRPILAGFWCVSATVSLASCGHDIVDLLRPETPDSGEPSAPGDGGRGLDASTPASLPDGSLAEPDARGEAGPPGDGGGGCLTSDDCSEPTGVCEPISGACVECVVSSDCFVAGCDMQSHRCIYPRCELDSDCPPFSQCHPDRQVCVQCVIDDDCRPFAGVGFGRCGDGRCVQCTSSADCRVGAPVCVSVLGFGLCVECIDSTNCSDGGTCGGDLQCHAGAPVAP
jgi:hypothetical protein